MDPHLHKYEVLYNRLFECIQGGLATDAAVSTAEQRLQLGLRERCTVAASCCR